MCTHSSPVCMCVCVFYLSSLGSVRCTLSVFNEHKCCGVASSLGRSELCFRRLPKCWRLGLLLLTSCDLITIPPSLFALFHCGQLLADLQCIQKPNDFCALILVCFGFIFDFISFYRLNRHLTASRL